jgi:hypothetical protein
MTGAAGLKLLQSYGKLDQERRIDQAALESSTC